MSSNRTTPLQSRLQPCSGCVAMTCAAAQSGASAAGHNGRWKHINHTSHDFRLLWISLGGSDARHDGRTTYLPDVRRRCVALPIGSAVRCVPSFTAASNRRSRPTDVTSRAVLDQGRQGQRRATAFAGRRATPASYPSMRERRSLARLTRGSGSSRAPYTFFAHRTSA